MNRNDFMSDMIKTFPEELADFNKYHDAHIKAKAAGYEDIAYAMACMAHDEFTHMTYIRNTVCENGTPLTADHEKLYNEAHVKHNMMTK